jgi:hypothetical protein
LSSSLPPHGRACLVALLLTLTSAAAHADGRVFVTSRASAQAWPLRATDGQVAPRRLLAQTLALRAQWSPTRQGTPVLESLLSLRLDEELDLTSELAQRRGEDAQRLARVDLQLAHLRGVGLLDGALDLDVGRIWVLDPVTHQQLDGLQAGLRGPEGLRARAYLGDAVTPASPWANQPLTGAPWHEAQSPAFRLQARTLGLGLGVERPSFALHAALRRSLAPNPHAPNLDPAAQPPARPYQGGPSTLGLDDVAGLALRADLAQPVKLEAQARASLPRRQLDRADLDLAVELPWQDLQLGAHVESFAPAFDLASVFSVFGPRPTAQTSLRADASPGGAQLGLQAQLTAYGDPTSIDLVTPWSRGAEHNLGLQARAAWEAQLDQRAWAPNLTLDASTRLEEGYAGRLLLLQGQVGTTLYQRLCDVALQGVLISTDPRDQPLQRGIGGLGALWVRLWVPPWGRLDAGAEWGSTSLFSSELRLSARYTLDVEVLR